LEERRCRRSRNRGRPLAEKAVAGC
jgi:hypothetical protein